MVGLSILSGSQFKIIGITCLVAALVGAVMLAMPQIEKGAVQDSPVAEDSAISSKDRLTELAQSATEFQPHKALYDIRLAKLRSGAQIVNIHGQMFYELQADCDGWITKHRFNLFYEYADSPALNITSDFSSYERFDGRKFDFSSRRKQDGALFEELRGQAILDETLGGVAIFSMPEDKRFDLAAPTFFPVAHSYDVLKRVQAGEKFFSARMFDGSDSEGPVEITAFVGEPVMMGKADDDGDNNIDRTLLEPKAHDLRLAFFPLSSAESTPDYEMSLAFHENGIISHMYIDYEDFSVDQTLSALEPLERISCDPSDEGGR